MLAYHNDPSVKRKYLTRLRGHRLAEELVQGRMSYWSSDDNKGCAVGCTLHSAYHSAYEIELGIPTQLALIQEALFERLPAAEARTFPERFLEAINVGADLDGVWEEFLEWRLSEFIGEPGVQKHGLLALMTGVSDPGYLFPMRSRILRTLYYIFWERDKAVAASEKLIEILESRKPAINKPESGSRSAEPDIATDLLIEGEQCHGESQVGVGQTISQCGI